MQQNVYKIGRGLFVLGLLVCLHTFSAYSSGYQVLLQGNRSTAMGNLGVALSPDASSMFFNPGAMTFMEGSQVMLGANGIFNSIAYWNNVQNSGIVENTDNPTGTPFHVYGVFGADDSNWKFGLGAYTPFGSGVKWGTDWTGKYLLDELTLRAIYAQATVAYKINDQLSIGAGFVANFGSVNLQRTLPISGEDRASVELDGNADVGFGYNIGIFYKPSNQWQIGVSYRSRIDAEVKGGDANFENIPNSLNPPNNPELFLFPTTTFSASLPLPSSINVGVGYLPNENLEIGIQVDYVGWGAYESLNIDFEDNTLGLADSNSPRNYEDSWVFHLGGEYKMNALQFRAGGYYDISPVQDGYMTPETPDANRIGLTAGIGYTVSENFQIDLSFLYIMGQEREQTVEQAQAAGTYPIGNNSEPYAVQPGTYKLRAYIPGLSLSYKF
jgi:long-chain fatty acid transport protein